MRKTIADKGITLIALIITIIVLLILAVVTIRSVTNDGIINYAENARTEYEQAQKLEQELLANLTNDIMNVTKKETPQEKYERLYAKEIALALEYGQVVDDSYTFNYEYDQNDNGNAIRLPSEVTSIAVPWGVTKIGKYEFYLMSLEKVILPETILSIEYGAFYACRLKSINIPSSVTSIGDSAFKSCGNLTSINIPDSITTIEGNTFAMAGITSINIPNSVTKIGYNAFEDCSKLTSINIPNSVTSIGNLAFQGCSNLTTVNYTGTEEEWNAITIGSNNSALTNATIVYNYKTNQ